MRDPHDPTLLKVGFTPPPSSNTRSSGASQFKGAGSKGGRKGLDKGKAVREDPRSSAGLGLLDDVQ